MNEFQRFKHLFFIMVKEEFRLYTSMVGRFQFLFFPMMLVIFSLIISLSAPSLLEEMPEKEIYRLLPAAIGLYGLGVGGFALSSDSLAERRMGPVNLLLESPTLHPVSFKELFGIFYLKDLLFYIFLTIGPLVLGMALSVPVTGFRARSLLFLTLTLSLTFSLGLSASFAFSVVYVRWHKVFKAVVLLFLLLMVGGPVAGLYGLEAVLPSLAYQYNYHPLALFLSLVLALGLTGFALEFVKPQLGKRSSRYPQELLAAGKTFALLGSLAPFLAKEWVDLKRSRALYPVLFSYIGPLLILTAMVWFATDVGGMDMEFNLLFYASMIGFFGITIYAWLGILDSQNFYEVLPVTVPRLIRSRLWLFSFLSIPLSTLFLVGLAVRSNETDLLWLAFPVSLVTSRYTVLVTAYLTGLKTSSALFDPVVLGKFMLLVTTPLIIIMFLSFALEENFQIATQLTAGVCVVLVGLLLLFDRGLERKWGGKSFLV